MKCLSLAYYPPQRYIFYPLYRYLRRHLRLPMAVSYLAVYLASAIIHFGLLYFFGRPVQQCIGVGLLFVGLGLMGTGMIVIQHRE